MRNKDKFEFFRIAMVTGLLTKEEVVNWADRELEKSNQPDPEVIDISLAGKLPYSQIIGLLNTYQGAPDHKMPVNIVLAFALEKTQNKLVSAKRIIQGIRLINAEAGIESETKEGLTIIEKELKQLESHQITELELSEKLITFLSKYSGYSKELLEILNN